MLPYSWNPAYRIDLSAVTDEIILNILQLLDIVGYILPKPTFYFLLIFFLRFRAIGQNKDLTAAISQVVGARSPQ